MQSSRMRKGIFLALAAVVVLTVASAGCFDNIDFLPKEVQNRGNIIAVDSEYIGSSTVLDLLMTPEKYQNELFVALDAYLPKDKPVIDIEVGIGVAMANISKQLKVPKEQIALTSNQYMLPLLEQTIAKNNLVVDLRNEIISYSVGEGEMVPVVVSKNLEATEIMNSETQETVMVPVTTISEILSTSNFKDTGNVTLVVEDPTLIGTILEHESDIQDHIALIIAVSSGSSAELSQIMNYALKAGYTPAMVGTVGINDCCALVFERAK